MATIKAIEGRTVHQIQSGQVIVDLCSVVKELVENGLDAGATSIDVRFRNQGLESIEVQDNGDGIAPHNYETLALKHHTSKLATYSDLTTLQTYGFRGEALSSLCALSNFSVTTCMAADAPKGTKLEFEVSGKLKSAGVTAAQKGTTVSVENLFNNLPVRRRELERNIKREWAKVVGVLGQYACIQTGIKFSVSQQAGKGKKTSLFSTKGNKTTRENIVNVFGAKKLTALVPMDLKLELEETSGPSQRRGSHGDGGQKDIRIVGHISRPASGEGRQTPDRQMFFVNSRPCGLPQVAKAFNEVYKTYNASQSPFIFANIELDTHLYDVNVSPDKRTILLHDQTQMLENLKDALIALFDSQDYTVPISQLTTQKQPSYKQLTINREASTTSSATPAKQGQAESYSAEELEGTSLLERGEQSSQGDGTETPRNSRIGGSVVSLESTTRDRKAVTLISDWASRNVDHRVELKPPIPKPITAVGELSQEKHRFVEKLEREREEAEADKPSNPLEESLSPVSTAQSSLPPATFKPPKQVADFNEIITELQESRETAAEKTSSEVLEPRIPSLQTPAKSPLPLSSQFSSSAKSRRTPGEIATITIGDHTVTSSLGGPSLSRPPASRNSRIKKPKAAEPFLPSFGSRLSQIYGAPGATQISTLVDDEIEESREDGADSPASPGSSSNHTGGEIADGKPLVSDQEMSLSDPSEDGAGDVGNESPTLFVEDEQDDVSDQEPLSTSLERRDEGDSDYIDEDVKKAQEEAKVQQMIRAAEEAAIQPSQANIVRAKGLLKGGARKKDSTLNLVKPVETSASEIETQFLALEKILSCYNESTVVGTEDEALDSDKAEEKLSLTISKSDFAKMKIIGQFNLGFIIASKTSEPRSEDGSARPDNLFIIDQHASDEKYNFERLQSTTILQSQRLVHPKTLELTALEEEIVLENLKILETNGFILNVDQSGESPVGQRCQVVALPISRETTFSLEDLDELLALLTEYPSGSVPRPSKVRKMFAMRACRSSIMIGKTLTKNQMGNVVRHMGEIDKPWNCPHGRPTMRHLCGLGVWDGMGWKEGDVDGHRGVKTDWGAYIRSNQPTDNDMADDETEGDEQDAEVEIMTEQQISEDEDMEGASAEEQDDEQEVMGEDEY